MNKRIAFSIAVMALLASAIFAGGQKENPASTAPGQGAYGPGFGPGGPGPMGMPGGFWQAEPKTISVSGTVSVDENGFPVLTDAGVSYLLLCPRYLVGSLDLSAVTEAAVEGYLVPAFSRVQDESVKSIRVTKAVINGTEYDLSEKFPDQAQAWNNGCPGCRANGGRGSSRGSGRGR